MSNLKIKKIKGEILNLTLKNIILIGTIGAGMGASILALIIGMVK